jgi:hypothetical protein
MPSLLDLVKDWTCPVYATFDGAKFDNLPGLLAKADIFPRSLFIGQDDDRAIKSGPWFAALGVNQLRSLMRIEGIEGATVLWRSPANDDVVYHHFRKMNLIDVPRPKDARPDPFALDPETVLFRHWDPAVVGMILPILDPAQRSQLFGPMEALAINNGAPDGARIAKRRPDWPAAAPGRIGLSEAQMATISSGMDRTFTRRIVTFLHEASPERVGTRTEPAMMQHAEISVATGRAMGLQSERGLGQWSWLMLVSSNDILNNTEAVAWITSGAGTPDDRMEQLLLGIGGKLYRQELRT